MSEENPYQYVWIRSSDDMLLRARKYRELWEAALSRTPEQFRADQAITAEREKVERASRRCECDCHDDWWEDER
jgi:hypothetical protein